MAETLFAKVVDGVVVEVRVVSMAFIRVTPDRYGDSSLWVETFSHTEGKTYAGIGYKYNLATRIFTPPVVVLSPKDAARAASL